MLILYMKEIVETPERLVWDKMKSGDEKSLTEIFTLYYSDH